MKGIITPSIVIMAYLIGMAAVSSAIKCSGAWSNHACFGGNGKRGHGLEELLLSRLHSKRMSSLPKINEAMIRNARGRPRQKQGQTIPDQGDEWSRPIFNKDEPSYIDNYDDTAWKRFGSLKRTSIDRKAESFLKHLVKEAKPFAEDP